MTLWTKEDLMSACKASDPTSNFQDNFENINGISIDERTIKNGDKDLYFPVLKKHFS